MKLIKIGSINSKGKIIVSDPCYENPKDYLTLNKVIKGKLDVFIKNGKMKRPIFEWDKIKENTRNFSIICKHESFKKQSLIEIDSIGVDSGQAGFFIPELYRKKSDKKILLENEPYNYIRDSITSDLIKIKRNKDLIKLKNEKYQDLRKIYKYSEKDFDKKLIDENKNLLEDVKKARKTLKTKKYPSYLEKEFSNDFYEIICDLTCGEFFAGVNEYGAVSQSGIGDGYYKVKIAKNNKKEIIFIEIKFLK